MAVVLEFKPGVVSGNKLSTAEYEERQKACTAAALASLQGTQEYKAWQREKKELQRAAAAAGTPVVTAVLLVLLTAGGFAGVWRATRPPYSGLSTPAESIQENNLAAFQDAHLEAGPSEMLVFRTTAAALTSTTGQEPASMELDGVNAEAGRDVREHVAVAPEGVAEAAAELTEPDDLAAQLEAAQHDAQQARLQLQYEEQVSLLQQQLDAALAARRQAEEESAAAIGAAAAAFGSDATVRAELQAALVARQEAEARAAEAASAGAEREADLQRQLEAAVAAQQRAQQEAGGAAAAMEQALQEAQAAKQQAETAGKADVAALEAELEAVRQQLQEARAHAGHAAAEQDESLRAQLADAQQKLRDMVAQTGQAAAMAATQDAALRAELRAAQEAKQQAEEAAVAAAQEAAVAIRRAAEAQAAFPAVPSFDAAVGEAGTCSTERLWLEQPQLVATMGVAAAAILLVCTAFTAWVVQRRIAAAAAATGPAVASKQLAQLQRQLDQAQQANEARVAEYKKVQAAAEAARQQLEQKQQWEAAATQLAQATAEVQSRQGAASPTPRAPLAARCSNQRPAGVAFTGTTIGAAPAVLPAGKADTPAAWLDLLQQRFTALGAAAARAEAAAAEAGTAADEAKKEQAWGQEKVSEMLTENELLKERLADAKQAFAKASAAENAARAAATGLKAELEGSRQALVAAEAAAMQQQRRLEAELAAVWAERDELQLEVEELKRQLAAKEVELAALGECLGGLERENSNLEAQVDQVTQALIEKQAQRSHLERRVAELEQDVSSLGMLAEKLEDDKAVLEEQLAEAREAQAELCLASQQYIAADSAIKSIQASEETELASGGQQDNLLRRAVEEKVHALDLLASAERKLVEQQADHDGVPALPVHQMLLSGRRLSDIAGGSSANGTPRSRSARMAAFLGSKLGRVARLLSGDLDGASDPDSTPNSARSVDGSPSVNGGMGGSTVYASADQGPHNIAAWLSRTQGLFSSVKHLLGQELGGDIPGIEPPQERSPAALSLPSSARQREQQAQLEAALDHSSLEVQDLLATLDATTAAANASTIAFPAAAAAEGAAEVQVGGAGGAAGLVPVGSQLEAAEEAVLAARQQLAEAHERVQGARQQMSAVAAEAEGIKQQHAAIRDQVSERQHAVDQAQDQMEAALRDKQAAERGLARAEEDLASAQAQLEGATRRKQSAEPHERQACQEEYERCTQRRAACLADKQAALMAKQGAIEAAKAAAEALAAAEEEVERVVDQLCHLEDGIHAAMRRRSAAHDELLRQQTALADVVAVASDALEQHAAATRAATAASIAHALSNTMQGPSPLTPEELAVLGSPHNVAPSSHGSQHISSRASGGGTGLLVEAVEAQRVAELLEDSWFSPRNPGGSEMDGRERSVATLDQGDVRWQQEEMEGQEEPNVAAVMAEN